MQRNLQFIVMAETNIERRKVLEIVINHFSDAIPRKENSCDLHGNWLEVWGNDDADPQLASDNEDGYLYYRWRVEVTPTKADVDEDRQIQFARDLKACFESTGAAAEILAAFEDRL